MPKKRRSAQPNASPNELSSNEDYNIGELCLTPLDLGLNAQYCVDQEQIFYYVLKEKRQEVLPQIVGPAVKVLCKLVDPETQEKSFLLQFRNETFILPTISDTDTIESYTGYPILKPQDFLTILALQVKTCPEKYLLNTTGWFQGRYYTPIVEQNDIVWQKDTFFLDFERDNADKQLQLIYDALQEGKLLGLLYVASAMALFPDSVPYVVFVSGQRGVGKTTACQLATNLYGTPKTGIAQMYATNVGLELTLAECKDTAVLFDEALVNFEDKKVEDIIFQICGGRTKTRGRKDLTTDKGVRLKLGLFTTSERILELQKGGTMRRLLSFEVGDRNDITTLFQKKYDVNEALNYGGCILELVDCFVNHAQELSKPIAREVADKLGAPDNFAPAVDLVRALLLFEKFYNCKFEKLRNTIADWFAELSVELKKDLLDYFFEAFPEWIIQNYRHFRVEDTAENPVPPVYGLLKKVQDKQYYPIVLASAMAEFCKENPAGVPMPRNILIKQLKAKNLLKTNESDYYRMKGDSTRYFYVLIPINFEAPELASDIERIVAQANLTGEVDEHYSDEEELSEDILPF